MKHRYIQGLIVASILGLTLFQFSSTYTNNAGPPNTRTGAPGEQTCRDGCHTGTSLNGGSFRNNISISTDMVDSFYAKDSTYEVTVSFSHPGLPKAGFEMTALDDANNNAVGSFTITNSTTTQKATQFVNGSTREYVKHTSSGTNPTNNQISWKFDWQAPSTNQGDVTFYLALNSADGTGNNAFDTIYTKTQDAVFYPNTPEPSIQASDTNNICTGDTITFTGSATNNPTDWDWNFPSSATPGQSNQKVVDVVFNQSGSYDVTLRASDAIATSEPDTLQVQVNSTPNAQISVNGPQGFCKGDSVELTASSGNNYDWSTGETTQSIDVNDSGSYFVVVSNGNCSDTSSPVTIDDFPERNLSLNASMAADTFCSDQSITFNATTGFAFYQFVNLQTSDTLASGSSDSLHLASPANDLDMVVYAQDTNGCIWTSDTIVKSVDTPIAAPNLQCSNTTPSSITYGWDPVAGANTYEVSVDSGQSWFINDSTSYQLENLDFEQSYELWVRGIDSNSKCFAGTIAKHTCQSDPCSQLSFDLSYDSLVCKSDSAQFAFSNLSTQDYAISFAGRGYSDTLSYTFAPTQPTDTVEVSIIDSNQLSCPPRTFEYEVKQQQLQVTLSADKNNAQYCESDTVTVTGDLSNGLYDFYLNDSLVAMGQDSAFQSADLKDQDSLYAIVADTNGCKDTTNGVQLDFAPRPDAGFTYSTNDLEATFTDTTMNVNERVWHFGDGATDTQTTVTHTYDTGGTYEVVLEVTSDKGCKDTTSEMIDVQTITGSKEVLNKDAIQLYPNPVKSELHIELNKPLQVRKTLTIRNAAGKTLKNSMLEPGQKAFTVPVHQLSEGMYLLRLGTRQFTFLKQ